MRSRESAQLYRSKPCCWDCHRMRHLASHAVQHLCIHICTFTHYPLICASISFMHSFVHPSHSSTHSFIHSFVRSFIRSYICSFLHSCPHSSLESRIPSFIKSISGWLPGSATYSPEYPTLCSKLWYQILVNSKEGLHRMRAPNSAASHTLLSFIMKFQALKIDTHHSHH